MLKKDIVGEILKLRKYGMCSNIIAGYVGVDVDTVEKVIRAHEKKGGGNEKETK